MTCEYIKDAATHQKKAPWEDQLGTHISEHEEVGRMTK
jgi:hypothetical protein